MNPLLGEGAPIVGNGHARRDRVLNPATRTGRWVQLVPMTAEYMEFAYRLATDEATGVRWRLGGGVPTPEADRDSLLGGVFNQFVVLERRTSVPIGHLISYGIDLNHGVGYVGGAMVDEAQASGLGIEATYLYLRYLFETYRLRKLYFEVPEYNLGQMAGGVGTIMKEEGRLRDHSYYGGRFWDRVFLALYREDVMALNLKDLGRRRRVRTEGAVDPKKGEASTKGVTPTNN
jgi:hypothetical protein